MKATRGSTGASTGRRTSPRVERRPYAPVRPRPDGPREDPGAQDEARRLAEVIDRRVLDRQVRTGLGILCGIALTAIAVALGTMTRTTFLPGAAFLFLFLLTFGAPFWIAAVHTEAADARARLEAKETRRAP